MRGDQREHDENDNPGHRQEKLNAGLPKDMPFHAVTARSMPPWKMSARAEIAAAASRDAGGIRDCPKLSTISFRKRAEFCISQNQNPRTMVSCTISASSSGKSTRSARRSRCESQLDACESHE